MTKSVLLKLSKIKYSGDSIGDDIRVEIEILGKFLRVDKRIKAGTTVEINQEVGRFGIDRGSFIADVSIIVIEKDLLFNDVGSASGSIKVNVGVAKPQQFVFEIKIRETRSILGKFWGAKTAVFEVTLEAIASDAILYVSFKQSKNGWIQARKKGDKTKIDLPAYLKVRFEKQDNRRQYFTIMEGPWRQMEASLEIQDNNVSYFESANHQIGPVRLTYSRSKKILKFKNKIYKLKEYKNDPEPWKNAIYDVKIPDFYHGKGRPYLDRAKLAPVWFKTTHQSNDRYIHVGAHSLGCVTFIEIERWDELCEVFMKARKGDGEGIGILEVID